MTLPTIPRLDISVVKLSCLLGLPFLLRRVQVQNPVDVLQCRLIGYHGFPRFPVFLIALAFLAQQDGVLCG